MRCAWLVALRLALASALTSAPSLKDTRRFYDVVGRALDLLAPFEDGARRRALELGDVARARRVVELGCGTGRAAAELLRNGGAIDAYTGVDASTTMAALARDRLAPFPRARVERRDFLDGPLPAADAVVAFYVLDLLSAEDADAVLGAARAALAPSGGRFVAASIAFADGAPASRAVMRTWAAVSARAPALLGGCRPVPLVERFRSDAGWTVVAAEATSVLGYASEVVVATPA